jgi:hypothetical protein
MFRPRKRQLVMAGRCAYTRFRMSSVLIGDAGVEVFHTRRKRATVHDAGAVIGGGVVGHKHQAEAAVCVGYHAEGCLVISARFLRSVVASTVPLSW